jgi:uncharacterized membrane protein YfhO
LNISGYDFIKRFNYSKYTQSEELNQTYLYKNSLFLPRYSIIPNAILVVGEDNSVKQAVYWLMLNKNFDPKKGIIVKGKNKISDYSLEELNKFNAIVLTKDSIDQNSINILNRYVENGKIILPDITKNKQSIEDAEIESLFQSLKGNFEEIKTEYYSPDKIIFNIKNQRGFIFISEQYSIYPGWDVFIDNKESNILRADGVFSSVYIDDKNKNIVFEYNSKSFFYGSMISIISLMIILFYISYLLVNIHKNKKIHENERKL